MNAPKESSEYFTDMIAFLCKHYGWTPDYVLKKLTLPQAFIYYDKAIEQRLIESGQKVPIKTLGRKQHEAEARRIVDEVDEFKKRMRDKKNA